MAKFFCCRFCLVEMERFKLADPMTDLIAVSSPEELLALQAERRQVRVEASLRDYIVRIARATRHNADIQLGASPRATPNIPRVTTKAGILVRETSSPLTRPNRVPINSPPSTAPLQSSPPCQIRKTCSGCSM